jgi:DNA-binding transcriptional MerR regulator
VTLSLWEERFGYPVPDRSTDGQRRYSEEMMVALRDALCRGLSIASAITEARRTQPAHRVTRNGEANLGDRFVTLLENTEEAQ